MKTSLVATLGRIAAAFLLTSSAGAVDRGWYAGGFYGESENEQEQAVFASEALVVYDAFGFAPQSIQSKFEASDSTYSFFAGYRLLRNVAFEAGYIDLGKVEYSDQANGIFLDTGESQNWNQRITSEIGGFTFSALGILPLNHRIEAFVRGGVLFSGSERRLRISDGVGFARGNISESDVDLLAGAGLGFTFVEIYTLRAEYQRVFDAGDPDVGEGDLDVYTLGISVTF